MEQEKIYVVVPVYKVEQYLERCVESILNQTYDNYELILVDDGSPDNCPAICDEYAAKYDHITVIHQENGGLSAARNAGIEYALEHGDKENSWINFIDSDDFVHPCYLEYLYRAAKETGTDISSCGFVRTEASEIDDLEQEELKYVRISPEEYLRQKTANANIGCGKLYRLFLFEGIRYPVGKIYEDDFTTHKLLFQHSEIAVIWTPLYYWYLNRKSISQSAWTPARIDKLDALETQLVFFMEKGHSAAYKNVLETLLINSVFQYRTVLSLSPQYDTLLSEMKTRQNRAIKLYAKTFGLGKTMLALFDLRIKRPLKHMLRNRTLVSSLKRKLKRVLHH